MLAGSGAGAGAGAQDEGGSLGAAVVKLDRPRQFDGALALKSEKIVYCPIQKVLQALMIQPNKCTERPSAPTPITLSALLLQILQVLLVNRVQQFR